MYRDNFYRVNAGVLRHDSLPNSFESKSGTYRDIIYLPHPVSVKHPPMSMIKRAAQFAPFSALTGLEANLAETGRLTQSKADLREDIRREIDRKLWFIKNNLSGETPVTITYFVPDKTKEGGAYITKTGCVIKTDELARTLILQDKTQIAIKYITDIQGDILP